jgi:DNA-binding NtrC family response regulator
MHLALVEDDPSLRYLMEQMLRRRGYRISCFDAPAAAEAAVRADPAGFDVVVTDHGMPSATGIDLARALQGIRADLRVILVSGYVTGELRARALSAGVWRVLPKPLSANELCDVIHALLSAPG